MQFGVSPEDKDGGRGPRSCGWLSNRLLPEHACPREWKEGPGLHLCRRKAGGRGRTLLLEAEQGIFSRPGRKVEPGSCRSLPSRDTQLGRALAPGSSGTNQQEEVS